MDYFFWIFFILSNASFMLTVARLQVCHKTVFEEMGIDGRLFCGSIKQLATIVEFTIKRRPIQLNDKLLIFSSYTFLACFIAWWVDGLAFFAKFVYGLLK